MPQFLSKYMGIRLSPCIIYRGILDTGGSYCTNSALCSGVEAEALLFLLLLLDVEHQGHQLVALPLLAFHKVVNELP